MDIRSKAASPSARLILRDANDDIICENGREAAVRVYGPASKQYAAAMAAQQNRIIDTLKHKGKANQTADQKRIENAEFLADITEAFENVEYDDLTGRELAVAVYSDATIGFIADQVAKFAGEWSNFTKPSTQN